MTLLRRWSISARRIVASLLDREQPRDSLRAPELIVPDREAHRTELSDPVLQIAAVLVLGVLRDLLLHERPLRIDENVHHLPLWPREELHHALVEPLRIRSRWHTVH